MNCQLASNHLRSALQKFSATMQAMDVVLVLRGKSLCCRNYFPQILTYPGPSFETHDVCEEVIKEFDGTPVCREGGEEHIIHIRFADTHDQKMLKQQTAAARQFRAAEFEYGCLQAGRG